LREVDLEILRYVRVRQGQLAARERAVVEAQIGGDRKDSLDLSEVPIAALPEPDDGLRHHEAGEPERERQHADGRRERCAGDAPEQSGQAAVPTLD
jgi:hypothetical protein